MNSIFITTPTASPARNRAVDAAWPASTPATRGLARRAARWLAGAWLALTLATSALAASAQTEACLAHAAQYHAVNPHVLRAILTIESGLSPSAVSVNANGSVDLGIGQINSVHFPQLARHGIEPAQLMDGCTGTYVAAWHLKKMMLLRGNTWEGLASYHSSTPYFNRRYQVLLRNELVRAGVLAGPLQAVPPLRPTPAGATAPLAR